jgi:hypothetical protein
VYGRYIDFGLMSLVECSLWVKSGHVQCN